ncbi:hypothetical protein GCM10008015_29720 [Flavobacterium palustre]|uniref:Outer membrane protein beta-barrel domain-containing protein n=1 Tax=Flavobacterium palustre TaxID=1476463 RepID=A0ABQ1HTJ4_9FLAO|nr:hypothetical protein [Flavobacterium palustre]GGA87131.1 hypothetical protein GCM10008015_29720 [Flavobacterium palustre]
MIKNYLFIFFFLLTIPLFSQELYFKTGKNYTKYIYKDESLQVNPNIQSGTGGFYEVGFEKPLGIKKVSYQLGLSLNDYNAIGGNSANSYRWDTQYLGVHGGFLYSLLSSKNKPKKDFDFLVKTALDCSTMIYGKQEINGNYYDLKQQKEFSGIILQSSIGFSAKYAISSFGALSLGYNFCQSINITNTSKEKLSFNTNQLELGVHFNIN